MTVYEQILPDAQLIPTKERRKRIIGAGSRRKMLAVGMIVFTVVVMSTLNNQNLQSFLPSTSISSSYFNFASSARDLQETTDDDDPRKLAWFISFPEAGTTYTMHVVQQVSGKATASNYGTVMIDDDGNNVPVLSDSIPVYFDRDGPSFSTIMPSPDKYVLTRSHSHGTCFDCAPFKYLGPSAHLRHMNTNRFGSRMVNGQMETFEYDMALVKKLMVLVRDPMDNIAARFFVKVERELMNGNAEYASTYPKDRVGFRKWCQDMNTASPYNDMERNWFSKNGFWEEAQPVPCRAEFVKYFSFYNMIRQLGIKYNLEMKTITFKDLAENPQETVGGILSFLELPQAGSFPENLAGSGQFHHFYSEDEMRAIARLGQKMVLGPAVWQGFGVYLNEYLP